MSKKRNYEKIKGLRPRPGRQASNSVTVRTPPENIAQVVEKEET
jgi:hypothetical protein